MVMAFQLPKFVVCKNNRISVKQNRHSSDFYPDKRRDCQKQITGLLTGELQFSLKWGPRKGWRHDLVRALLSFIVASVMTLSIVMTHLTWGADPLRKHWKRAEDVFYLRFSLTKQYQSNPFLSEAQHIDMCWSCCSNVCVASVVI